MVAQETAARYWQVLEEISDPEIPVVNIVEMGMIVGLQPEGESVTVHFRPTFSGCPALALIRQEIVRALKAAGAQAVTVIDSRTPWSTDAMRETAKAKLAAYGIAPPQAATPVCPRCASQQVALKNPFGATLCKMLYQCQSCGEPFEAFKCVR